MSDLISRQDAIDAVRKLYIQSPKINNDMVYDMAIDQAHDALENIPSAQEIIRCKDCIHFHYDFPYVIQGIPVFVHEICDFWGDGCKTSENEFCSHAERRS